MKLKLLLFLCVFAGINMSVKAIDHANWMQSIPDDMFVTNLSIPGTHDSGTKGFSFNAATQDLTIAEQLAVGVRALDLRPGVSGSQLYIFHGSTVHGSETFSSVIGTLVSFLDAHPTECLFVVMRKEYDSNSQWANLVKAALQPYASRFVDFVPYLTIGKMRGKILLMSRDSFTDGPVGTYFSAGWADNATSTNSIYGKNGDSMTVRLQDIYNTTTATNLTNKKNDIQNLMAECMVGNTHKLFINHTSGYTSTYLLDNRKIADNAEKCNEVAINYLNAHTGPVGMIMMDFAGKDRVTYIGSTCDTRGQILIDKLIENSYATSNSMSGTGNWILPMGSDHPWVGRYIYKEDSSKTTSTLDALTPPTGSWTAYDYDATSWNTMVFPMGSVNYGAVYCTRWQGEYNTYWIRREFNIDMLNTSLNYYLKAYHDDDYEIYVNGTRLDLADGWTNPGSPVIKSISSSLLRTGNNVVAVHIQQNWGGAYCDFGIYYDNTVASKMIVPAQVVTDDVRTNLAGQKVSKTYKGIVISNGRKILNK